MATDPQHGFLDDIQAMLYQGAEVIFPDGWARENAGLPGMNHHYIRPLVHRVPDSMKGWLFDGENIIEPFGPALGIVRVDDAGEAIALANLLPCLLSAQVIASDIEQAGFVAREIDAGQVYVNAMTTGANPAFDFGGPGLAANGTSNHARTVFRELTQHRVLQL